MNNTEEDRHLVAQVQEGDNAAYNRLFEKYHTKQNYIFNVGSGITPDINPEKVSLFLERLRLFNSK